MDPTTRWETEAMREGASGRPSPPRPTAKRRRSVHPGDRAWVTLREAETATGIPVNTLRKWVRRAGLASYLESDGETPVRMVDLDAVRARAEQLGREIRPSGDRSLDSTSADTEVAVPHAVEATDDTTHDRHTDGGDPPVTGGETMIVPVDAWNKMLTQLGNLHEAGQQLAEARERAAKAETEAAFLRDRLAEMRVTDDPRGDSEGQESRSDTAPDRGDAAETAQPGTGAGSTSYLRYLTSGWRNRNRGRRRRNR